VCWACPEVGDDGYGQCVLAYPVGGGSAQVFEGADGLVGVAEVGVGAGQVEQQLGAPGWRDVGGEPDVFCQAEGFVWVVVLDGEPYSFYA
jgi:hypothetical protein